MSSLFYREHMLDHAKNPRNFGVIDDSSFSAHVVNRHCGDELTLYLKEKNGSIEDIKYDGKGCAVSLSSASMLTEELKGRKAEELKSLKKEDVLANFGDDLTPSRQKCALLIYEAVKELSKKVRK